MIYRLIAPEWLTKQSPKLPKVIEGEFSDEQIQDYNAAGYNIYFLPNYPSKYDSSVPIVGSQIDRFNYIFVDCDFKDGVYKNVDEFMYTVRSKIPLTPNIVNVTGNGVHVYYQISDLDAMSYLRLSRRLMRLLDTDESVGQIFQLMRAPNTVNTKDPSNPKWCEQMGFSGAVQSAEQLDKLLPPITSADEAHCVRHYNKTMGIDQPSEVDDTLPPKFLLLLKTNTEVADIWGSPQDDRSTKDYRLGHILLANGFTRDEATSVLVNVPKALERGPTHRISYATSIVDKIWVHMPEPTPPNYDEDDLSESVEDIINSGESLEGTRFPCYKYIDDTVQGFRLGQVIGLVAGAGVGKTSIALNMIMGFVEKNPEHDHFIVSLEQPAREIAARWKLMTGNNSQLYGKVHIISNYNKDGSYRNLGLHSIEASLKKFKEKTGKKIGSVTIDHIGVLSNKGDQGEHLDLIGICRTMKSFAVSVDCILIMQSQTSREKAGIGDIDLNKDAAYGTVAFESFCDYLVTLHQPLKRCYPEGAPTVMSFKFCKIRHKKQHLDNIKEDVCYRLFFDPSNERLRDMTPEEDKGFNFFLNKCVNQRKADQKTDLLAYVSRSN